jgi:hypothetical protein
MTVTLNYTTNDNGDMIVPFDTHAELFAFCCAEGMTFNEEGTVSLDGLHGDETELLRDAIQCAARGKGNHAILRTNGSVEVDGD